jgi:putative transposase
MSSRMACTLTFGARSAIARGHRSTQRKVPSGREDEERLTADIIELARQYGCYGYRNKRSLR